MNISDYATKRTGSNIEKIYDLQTQLTINVIEIEALIENLEKITLQTPDDFDTLEEMFEKEFLLYMKNIGIYEDLINYINKEPKTPENELELARIARDAHKLSRVEVLEL